MSEFKRKRSKQEPEEEELEIDVNLPEPPSKKAKRLAKKAEKQKLKPKPANGPQNDDAEVALIPLSNGSGEKPAPSAPDQKQRSDYGIWIGNLNFSTTKDDLREFLQEHGKVPEDEITRIHMPPPRDGNERKTNKNRGFAYIDFATQELLDRALLLSEKLLYGRKVLIKNAKSFEGRPEKPAEEKALNGKANSGKEPSKRVFVGNLGFDVTKDELLEHFSQAGEVEDVFLATFEDSGKCKGFGWVRFIELDAAEAAVRGFVYKKVDDEIEDGNESEDDGVEIVTEKDQKPKKEKRRKWFINRLQGRELRCEFGEDAHTRYKKRFRKDANSTTDKQSPAAPITEVSGDVENVHPERRDRNKQFQTKKPPYKASMDKDQRRDERRKRHEKMDARKIAPGQAHFNAPRASAAIIAGAGKKTSFD